MRRQWGPEREPWAEYKGEWWTHPGRGAETWQGFGRRVLLRALLFFAFMFFVFAGLAAFLSRAIAALGSLQVFALLVFLAPFVLAVTLGIAGRAFMQSWRPVRHLIRAAGSLADGDYSVRVAPTSSRSLAPVVASFNEMARRLETASEQRRRLLADLGHELRTPLTVIRGEIEAMLDGVHQIDDEHLEMLRAEVEVMERLLEDLATLSLIEAGSLSLHPEPTDVGQLLEDVADGHRRRATEAGVELIVEVDPSLGELVIDPVRIREVLANLVVNSLRAMPDGGTIRLEARRAGAGAVIDVTDTGVGIGADDLEHVFDRFHKGSTSSGSGLGLTISRDLVAAHGGSISISSRLGAGTTVRIDLSRIAPGQVPAAPGDR